MNIQYYLLVILSNKYFLKTIFTKRIRQDFFASLGKIFLLISFTALFIPNFKDRLSQSYFIFILILFIVFFKVITPVFIIKERLSNRDIEIEIKVGNLFEIAGACIVSTNTTFDTSIESGIIAKDSLQGQFCENYYRGNIRKLDTEIEAELVKYKYTLLDKDRKGKRKLYDVGTTVKLISENKTFYLVAIAHLNENGAVNTTFNNIQDSLARLWDTIENLGNTEPVVIPLLGSGRCRLKETRIDFAKEIIKSFIAASANKKLCEKLTIVISYQDYINYDIDIYELGEYLKYQCKYTEFKPAIESNSGIGIDLD